MYFLIFSIIMRPLNLVCKLVLVSGERLWDLLIGYWHIPCRSTQYSHNIVIRFTALFPFTTTEHLISNPTNITSR